MRPERTQVGIIGGGPAGLMLSHLLAQAGIDSIVLEKRDPETIRTTHRAGILEAGSVRLLAETGIDGRVHELGDEHGGIDLRFGGESHPLDFRELVGATVTLYAQNEVFQDLFRARRRDDGDVRFGTEVTAVDDLEGPRPRITARGPEGAETTVEADFVIGADGSRSFARTIAPARQEYRREYPFAWFGILVEAPKSAPELIYAHSPHGFALISQRSETVQRMYFQCAPDERAQDWSEDRIWSELQRRVAGPDGLELSTGPLIETTVLGFRSYVHEPMGHGRLFLAGDAAHTVPPTGAKGLNLALHDARLLFEALEAHYSRGDGARLESYSERALDRVWKAQSFSSWMTGMMHLPPGDDGFDARCALGALRWITGSRYGQQHLAEAYTGWPHEHRP